MMLAACALCVVAVFGLTHADPQTEVINSRAEVIRISEDLSKAIADGNDLLAHIQQVINQLNLPAHIETVSGIFDGAERGSDLKVYTRDTRATYNRLLTKVTELTRRTRALDQIHDLLDTLRSTQRTQCEATPNGEGLYTGPDGVCYWVGGAHMTWDAARQDCWSRGMDLAAIRSEAEQTYIVTDIVDGRDDGSDEYWLGGRLGSNNEFVWVSLDNFPVNSGYTHWAWLQPDNWGGNEACMSLWNFRNWNDYPCDINRPYICQATSGY